MIDSLPSPAETHPPARQEDRGRAFIAGHPIRPLLVEGSPGYAVRVRLTSYRSLPLSCLEQITLAVDGVPVEADEIRFVLESHSYRLDELGRHSDVWWFILDQAELVVRPARPLAAGQHLVEGRLTTVEPYVSNGRFHFVSEAARTLSFDPAATR